MMRAEQLFRASISQARKILAEDGFYGLRRSDKPVSLQDVLDGKTSYNKRPARENNPHGTEFEYSDAGFCVLQMLLEDLEQKPFEVIADGFVFAPLNLKNTFFAFTRAA